MRAGPTKAASAVSAFGRPGHMLRFLIFDCLAHGGISFMGTIFAVHGALGRNGGEYGSDPGHVITETHVKIPFIMNREGLHALRDRMMRKLFIVGSPGWVHR